MSAVSKSEMSAAIAALAEVIREVRAIPSGHLYAQCMGHMTIEVYEKAIGLLKRAELVAEDGAHMLTWVGPEVTS